SKESILERPKPRLSWHWLACAVLLAFAPGCETPSAHTFSRNFGLREDLGFDPADNPSRYEDGRAEGGRLFKTYCGSCHNARPLSERPFAYYQVAVAHMRDQAYLTGKEYRQIIMFLRPADDVGPRTPRVGPSPKRLVFSHPIADPRGESQGAGAAAPPPAGASPFKQADPAGAPPAQPPAPNLPAPIE